MQKKTSYSTESCFPHRRILHLPSSVLRETIDRLQFISSLAKYTNGSKQAYTRLGVCDKTSFLLDLNEVDECVNLTALTFVGALQHLERTSSSC